MELLDELMKRGLAAGFGNEMFRLGFVKILVDGSLGAHTAALKKPYADMPETSGMLIYSQHRLNWLVLNAHKAGWQLAVHAIGDRAVESFSRLFIRL